MSDLKRIQPERYLRLLGLAVDPELPLLLVDAQGGVVWSSEPGCSLSGAAALVAERGDQIAEAEGADDLMFELPDGASLLGKVLQGATEPAGWVITAVARDGDSSKCRAALSEIAGCVSRELALESELEGFADELQERNEEVQIIYSFDTANLSTENGLGAIDAMLDALASGLSLELAALVRREHAPRMCTAHALSPMPDLDLVTTQLRNQLLRFITTRPRSLVLNDPDAELRRHLFHTLPHRLLACPITNGQRVEGMIVLLRHPDRPGFTQSEVNLATAVAQQSALILQNAEMVEQMRRFGHQMAGALITAVEAKDPYTRGHSQRVQAISVKLAESLEMEEADIEDIYWGALLHDIGKIGVPDAILCKNGSLTDDEYVFIQEHPEQSFEIMRHIEYLRPGALDGARYHQERYDGRGYPHGMAGNKIPRNARVIAVADTYDAITTSRSYRAASDHDEAMAEIVRVGGSQLDPDLVEGFEKLCRRGTHWLNQITSQRGD